MAGGASMLRRDVVIGLLGRLESDLAEAGGLPAQARAEKVRSCLLDVYCNNSGSSTLDSLRRLAVFGRIPKLSDDEADGVADVLRHVLQAARGCLCLDDGNGQQGFAQLQANMAGLIEIGRRAGQWLRPLEWWRPDGSKRPPVFQLARYLLARWPVPDILDGVWLWPECEAWRDWYVRMGAGGSAWPAPILYPMTRRQLHFFLQAPSECMLPMGVMQAGVWADARAMGASEEEALRLMGSRLGRLHMLYVPSKRPFGLSVIRFVLDHPEIADSDLDPLLQLIHDLKFGHRIGLAHRPELSLAGRSPDKLLREMRDWEAQDARRRAEEMNAPFPASGIEAWSGGGWEVVPVRTVRELIEEGQAQRHCVANHRARCAAGVCSIWSLRKGEGLAMKRMLTIEVMNGMITMVRGFGNRAATEEELGVLGAWAAGRGLKLLPTASIRRIAPAAAPGGLWPGLVWRISRQIVQKRPARRLI